MSDTAFDLVAHTKRAARDAVDSLEEPTDDILPVILSNGPRGLAIMGAVMPGEQSDRDNLALNITARIALAQATEAAMVCTAYMSILNTETGEVSERQENIVLVYCTHDHQTAWTAKLTRHDNRPPDMSIWEEMPTGAIGGRFAQAMSEGLAYARTVDPEIKEIIDAGYREGRVDELVAMFLKVLGRLRSES